ncbi:MAG: PQQ-binding-like beta-propeller repeat protein [Thermoplasmata archaeon]|nr:PQQ-binding-like beta-propeller repeat protein [Thermoplasmata archaeon]
MEPADDPRGFFTDGVGAGDRSARRPIPACRVPRPAQRTSVVLVALAAVLLLALPGGGLGAVLSAGRPEPQVAPPTLSRCPGTDWTTYLAEATRQANTINERTISPSSASKLVPLWNFTAGGPVVANPAIVNGLIYEGSWDGYEYAFNATTGHVKWKANLGVDTNGPYPLGITSSATVAKGVLYVGGGNSFLYALNASTGHTLWKVLTGNTSKGYYNWGSPLVANGFIYLGISSDVDANVAGGLLQISLATHARVHFFNTTANGTLGGTIWTSPAYNSVTKTVFVTTGNPGASGSVFGESILSFNATTLALTGHWAVPVSQISTDGDFGATPLLFTSSTGSPLVVASNKNGILYAWNQSQLGNGPVWNHTVALPSPVVGAPNLGPVSLGAGRIYVGTSRTNLSGTHYNGSIQAFVAGTGHPVWQRPITTGAVISAPIYSDGVLAFGAGMELYVLNASNGALLFHFNTTKHVDSWGPASISHGELVIGARNHKLYAFGLTSCTPGLVPAVLPEGSPVPSGTRIPSDLAVAWQAASTRPPRPDTSERPY